MRSACVILSGGLDSSIVAQLGKEALGLRAAFTVLATPDCTDRQHASGGAQRSVVQRSGARLEGRGLPPRDVARRVPAWGRKRSQRASPFRGVSAEEPEPRSAE